MIHEESLSFQRGAFVEFRLHLGGGPKTCKGLVLNTAVLNGRGARQLWILHMDGATPQHEQQWVNKKSIIPEADILCLMSSVVIGADTILRDNPICYPVQDTKGTREFEAIIGAIPSNQAKV